MKKLCFCLLVISLNGFSQNLQWKPISQQNKPWTRWWWQGSAVNKKDLTANMETYKKAGLGGLEITPIYGVFGEEKKFIEFLSPQWMQMLKHTIQEGKRLNMGIDVANASGWPFGGRWITDENSSKYIAYKTYELNEGERLNQTIQYIQEPILRVVGNQFYSFGEPSMATPPTDIPRTKNLDIKTLKDPIYANAHLQALAIDQIRYEKQMPLQVLMAYADSGEKVDLTQKVDKNGNLNWQAPAGKWKLYAVFQGYHGKMVERAGPGGEGYVIDHFSKKATDFFLNKWSEAIDNQRVTGVRAFFNDSYEVDDAKGQANFTPELFAEFKQRRGYDLRLHLDQLFTKEYSDKSKRVLSDYRETIADLLLENYTKTWANWAKKHKAVVRNQAHGSPANILDLYAAVDIPEIEGTDIYRIKFAPSAAHVTGKKLVSSESATWENDHFLTSLADTKRAIDLFFLGGVNHVFYHGTSYSPPNDAFPSWLFYAAVHFNPQNPFWNDFSKLNQYVGRTQSFLQAGKPDNDVLLYFPIYDKFAHHSRDLLDHFDGIRPEFANTDFEANAKTLQERGFAYDFISDKQLLNVSFKNNALQTGGNTYKTLVLSNVQYIPLETWQKIIDLAKSGATIVCFKNLPNEVNGLYDLENRLNKFKNLTNHLNFKQISEKGIQESKLGKGKLLIVSDLEEGLKYANIRRESMVEQNLQFNRRKSATTTQYFVVNQSDKKFVGWLPLAISAQSAAVYNPMTEALGYARIQKKSANESEVFVEISPNESLIIEAFPAVRKGTNYPIFEPVSEAETLSNMWEIRFKQKAPFLPPTVSTQNLVSWTEFADDSYKSYSGTAIYQTKFRTKPIAGSEGFLLKFEKIHESARVRLNGKEIAVLIAPPFEVFIPKNQLKTENILEMEVTNLMANRMAYMDKNNLPYKKFYNINFPSRFKENRDENGIFTAKNWEPKPSGLVGKVSIEAVKRKK